MIRVRPVVLAAGRSRRMGRPKAFLPFGDKTLIESTLDALAHPRLGDPVLVVRRELEADFAFLLGNRVRLIANPRADAGMVASVVVAMTMLDAADTHIMLALADMPFIQRPTIDALLERGAKRPKHAVVPVHENKPGHPALLPRWLLEEDYLRTKGARIDKLLDKFPGSVKLIDVDDPGILRDIDTPEEYERASKELRKE